MYPSGVAVGPVNALGDVAIGGNPERRNAVEIAAEIARRRIDNVPDAEVVIPGIRRGAAQIRWADDQGDGRGMGQRTTRPRDRQGVRTLGRGAAGRHGES